MASQSIPLKELGQISQGIIPSRYVSNQGETYRVVSVSDLEYLYVENVHNQVQLAIPDIQRYQLLENDVVIAIRGTLLKSSVVTVALQGSVCNQNTVFFRSKSHQVNPLYLTVLLRSEYFERLPSFRERQSTTTLPAIRVADLRNLEIPLPDLQTQNQIAQLFLSVEQAKKVTLSAIKTRQKLSEVALFQALGVQI
ncbi:restriction endonuclease subunit S [Nostoc sp.]|uniref:restriction endonuclease subunit S n=1 Tax=Nostoc sp. TaxID=1180 RepID=UPI002FFD574F